MIYLFCIFIILIGVFQFDLKGKKSGKSFWYYFIFFVLVLVAGLRYKVGGDTYPVMDYFMYQPDLNHLTSYHFVETRYPPLWIIFVSAIKSISNEFFVFQLIHAIIVNSAFFLFFKKHSNKSFTCILIYAVLLYFNYNTEIIRTALSVSLFLLFGYDFLIQKKWIKYSVVIFLSLGFHYESFILILFVLCHLTKNNSFLHSAIILIGTLSFMFSLDVIPVIGDALAFNEVAQHALGAHADILEFSFNLNGLIMYAFKIFIWVLALWLMRSDTTYNRFFIYLSIISVVFAFKYPVIFGRLMDFIYPLLTIELVRLLYEKRNMAKIIVLIGVFYSWGMFYFWKVANTYSYKQYFPYVSIFDPYEIPERTNVVYEYHKGM